MKNIDVSAHKHVLSGHKYKYFGSKNKLIQQQEQINSAERT
jgi:hypothetical protein